MDKCNLNKTEKLGSKQKQALRIIANENTNIKESMIKMKIVNILNIYLLKTTAWLQGRLSPSSLRGR